MGKPWQTSSKGGARRAGRGRFIPSFYPLSDSAAPPPAPHPLLHPPDHPDLLLHHPQHPDLLLHHPQHPDLLLHPPDHPDLLLHHPDLLLHPADHPDPLLHPPDHPDLLLHHPDPLLHPPDHPGFPPSDRRSEMPPVPLLCLALIALLPAALPTNADPGLPAPSNVRIDSYNMEHVVRWDPVELKDEPMPVMYRVLFGIYNKFHELCINITETECDVTSKIPHFYRGKPMVQAELGSRRSDWVVLPDFQPNRNTTIGPVKSLVLHSHSSKLAVDFSPPFSPIPSSWQITYNLSYWKENSEKKETVILASDSTYLLDNLEPNTKYCVQMYAFTRYLTGLVSDPVCEATVTAITLTVVLVCVFSFVLLFIIISLLVIPDRPIHKALSRIKIWLTGPYRIPSHIIQYLDDPPPLASVECPQNTFEEQYDNISIVRMELCQDGNEETSPDHSHLGSEKT